MSRNRILFTFVLSTVLAGLVIGGLTAPDAWYAALKKPAFNPPSWVFAPVWSVLYVLIGIAGARTFARRPKGPAMAAWIVQMVLNFAWSPVFFTLHAIAPALAIVVALTLANALFIVLTWRPDRLSALFFVPYVAWTAFAAVLNGAILRLAVT
ncbi:TspO/MBR family protein [Pararhizobium mangrovi]|uniref:Tryptophan-rich sensory protein n=1 Tax=Pararhizobium mangrovi TaxID=2590452 RepID=A0A506U5J9_9HYPH|nr:TspO/MBR family protein [Pararhizobium mangrovi]TPW28374.1 tryptophan-rich sensory protein [Pararhizobium mangrovi]